MARLWKVVAVLAIVCSLAAGGFYQWKQGTPYQEPFRSPNREYYVQKFSTMNLPLVSGPGQGSDSINGYIRLYTKSGALLHERWQTFIRDIEPIWAGNKVYLKGVAEMDRDPWMLPTSSE